MKRTIVLLVICLSVFWIGRIYSINQTHPTITYYSIGDIADCNDLELYFVESHLEELEQFHNRFHTNYEIVEECMILSVCIEVKNKSDDDINWSSIIDFLECGFESSVWGSAIDPYAGEEINNFKYECLKPKESQKVWFITEVNKMCFKESSWEHIGDYEYYYVLSLIPHKVAVRLDV